MGPMGIRSFHLSHGSGSGFSFENYDLYNFNFQQIFMGRDATKGRDWCSLKTGLPSAPSAGNLPPDATALGPDPRNRRKRNEGEGGKGKGRRWRDGR